jgi:hypothetical protein
MAPTIGEQKIEPRRSHGWKVVLFVDIEHYRHPLPSEMSLAELSAVCFGGIATQVDGKA